MPVKKALQLSRRTLLRGAGGVVVGLPLLECMLDGRPAWAQTATPKRYLVVFDGQSLGGDDDTLLSDFVPDAVGAGYDLKTALAPLGTAGVQSWVTVVSGMRIPTAAENGGTPPAGGRADDFHVSSASPLLSGVRSPSSNAPGLRSHLGPADGDADRRQQHLQVAGLPGPGGLVPLGLGAVRARPHLLQDRRLGERRGRPGRGEPPAGLHPALRELRATRGGPCHGCGDGLPAPDSQERSGPRAPADCAARAPARPRRPGPAAAPLRRDPRPGGARGRHPAAADQCLREARRTPGRIRRSGETRVSTPTATAPTDRTSATATRRIGRRASSGSSTWRWSVT